MEQSFLKGHANNRSTKAAAKRISHGVTTAQAVPIALTSTAFHLFFFPLQTRVERFRSLKCHINNQSSTLEMGLTGQNLPSVTDSVNTRQERQR